MMHRDGVLVLLKPSSSCLIPVPDEGNDLDSMFTFPMSARRAAGSVLAEGTRLGSYEIVSFAGAGGMGEVYRAKDTRLERIVALKVLPSEISESQTRRQRFLTEARAISSLKHPNVCTVHDIGSDDGIDFLVMEYVEGETLAARLRRGPLPIQEALHRGIEIAAALDAAHSAGIVHRDIKPGNIMLTKAGAKLLDFGLAKAPGHITAAAATAGTASSDPLTETGAIVGTIHYISPEQLDGSPADSRSDLFAFGAVLYEMVTGTRAFDGLGTGAIIDAILQRDPPPVSVVREVELPMLDQVVQRCLQKNPDARMQSARDVQQVLQWIIEEPGAMSPRRQGLGRGYLAALLAALTLATLIAAVLYRRTARIPSATIPPQYSFRPLETTPAYEGFPTWSPDGKAVAYVAEVDGTLQIFTRSLNSTKRTQITNLSRDSRDPFWSHDGTRIYFISLARDREGLWSVGAAGGAPRLVVPRVSFAAASPDGTRLALLREAEVDGESMSLWFADASGGDAQPYADASLSRSLSAGAIRFAPDGTRLGAWVQAGGLERPREFWEITMSDMKARKSLPVLSTLPRVYPFSWMADGQRIVFGADFDDRLPGFHLWIADTRDGGMQAITATHGNEYHPSVSPDGRRIVFSSEEADFDLLEIPLDGTPMRSLLATSRVEKMPVWAPDGSQYAFVTNRSGTDEIWVRSADGAWERPVATMKDFPESTTALLSGLSFSPDGKRLAYQRAAGIFRVWISNVVGGPPIPLLTSQKALEDHPTWSPDGEWIAFISFLEPDSAAKPREATLLKVRLGGQDAPVVLAERVVTTSDIKWSPDGAWITCETVDGMTLVSAAGGPSQLLSEESWVTHEWAKDGKSIYAIYVDEAMHSILAKVDVRSGNPVLLRDLGTTPPMMFPFLGLSLSADSRNLVTSAPSLRGDLWILEGFDSISETVVSMKR